MDACTTLVTLEPKLSDADMFVLVEACTVSIFDLPPPPAGDANAKRLTDQALTSLTGASSCLLHVYITEV